jgi:hypothetical protein
MKRKAGLIKELKRRNVFNVALAYIISSWLLAQVADLVLENFAAPPWVMRALLIMLAVGFPVALFVSWVFEVTSRGVIPESEIDRTVSIADQSGERLNRIIITILAIIIVFMGLERFVFSGHGSGRQAAQPEKSVPAAEPGERGSETGNGTQATDAPGASNSH